MKFLPPYSICSSFLDLSCTMTEGKKMLGFSLPSVKETTRESTTVYTGSSGWLVTDTLDGRNKILTRSLDVSRSGPDIVVVPASEIWVSWIF